MRTINNYIKEGFYKNVHTDAISLDMLNSYIEDVAKKNGFQEVGRCWIEPSTAGEMTSQLKKYDLKYTPGKTFYEIGFCFKECEYKGCTDNLYLIFETWYDDLEKRPRYTVDLKLQQPYPRKNYDSMSCRKAFTSKKCTLQWYPSAQEEIEDVISILASLSKTFEDKCKKEASLSIPHHTISKRTFDMLLNKFSKWLHTY